MPRMEEIDYTKMKSQVPYEDRKRVMWYVDPTLSLYVSLRDQYREELGKTYDSIFRNIFKERYDRKIRRLGRLIDEYTEKIEDRITEIEIYNPVIILRSDGTKSI